MWSGHFFCPCSSAAPYLRQNGCALRAVLAYRLVAVPEMGIAADTIPGPITARVVSVYDGDTLTVNAEPRPGITIRTSVRVSRTLTLATSSPPVLAPG